MMTEDHIKEAISLRYIELIAAYNGLKTTSSYPDYGTDLDVIEVGYRIENGKKRYSQTGRELKFQLKATTEDLISEDGEVIKYDLNAKTYNDLIERMNSPYPLFLILFILPTKEKTDWIKLSDTELITRKCAYWYFPKKDEIITKNTGTKRISIDKNNLFKSDTLNQLIENIE